MSTQTPLTVGATFSFRKTMTVAEQAMFTGISGNLGPLYVDAYAAAKAGASAWLPSSWPSARSPPPALRV